MALPWIIVSIFYGINEDITTQNNTLRGLFTGDAVDFFILVIGYLLTISISFACLNLIRHKTEYHGGLTQSATIFHNGSYFIGAIMIGILRFIWTFLWSLLLVFPGIIKRLAYSQAQFIYKDAVDNGQKMPYHEAITRSRHLMNGHKWELFVINLSFIGWWILSTITLRLADFWTMPYYRLTLACFYQKLTQDQNK